MEYEVVEQMLGERIKQETLSGGISLGTGKDAAEVNHNLLNESELPKI